MSEVESNKRLVWFAIIVFIIAGAGIGYAAVPQGTIRTTGAGVTTYVGQYGNFTESVEAGEYFLGAANITDILYTSQGATATVGFNSGLDYLPNYWYGDGAADDVQINAALTYVSGLGGGTVLLEQGDYNLVSTVNIAALTNLVGSGWDTVLSYNAIGDCVTILGDNAAIRNLKIVIVAGAGTAGDRPNGITSNTTDNLRIENVWLYGDVTTEASGDINYQSGIILNEVKQPLIENSVIENFKENGIVMQNSTSGIINNNKLQSNLRRNICLYNNNVTQSYDNIITNNVLEGSYWSLLIYGDHLDTIVTGNIVSGATKGITIGSAETTTGLILSENIVKDCIGGGIGLVHVLHSTISDNIITETGSGGYSGLHMGGEFETDPCDDLIVSGNTIYNNNGTGITVEDGDRILITGNQVYYNEKQGIRINVGRYITISSNIVVFNDASASATYDGISLEEVTDGIVVGNNLRGNNRYGIGIDADTINTIVKDNYIDAFNGVGLISDNGTNTRLSTLTLPFVDGTTFLSSAPFGWEIDVNTEYAVALGTLPLEVQQVVRWKIYATSVVTETHNMTLQVLGYGGADNQAYTTETVSIATLNSTSLNFAANDVIYWTVTASDDIDLDEMFGGDQIMIQVLHEAASGGACETDAVFTSIEIEYG